MEQRKCKFCGEIYPLNRDHFGNTPSGGFRWKCRSCVNNHVKKYKEQNPEWVEEKNSERQHRIKKAGGAGYSLIDLQKVRRLLDDKCAYCGEPLNGEGHKDHMTPVVRGGRDDIDNITLCCMKCNLAKHAKTVEEFIQWRLDRNLPVRKQAVSAPEPTVAKKKLVRVRKSSA